VFDGAPGKQRPLRYGSVCSGIEAASVAWHPLGWKPIFFSEIEAFPRAVLAERWPSVPIHGDFMTINEGDYEAIDLLVGGTPCQDFSVAGLRAGLAGDRGGLTVEFGQLARRLRPRWLVWENVPGILSIDGGRAFGAFLRLLAQCGYGFAYRVLDAQHFGVPQRRRRVFVVGYLGDWRPPAAVLFERESLRGDSPPRRETGQRVAPILEVGARTGKSTDDPRAGSGIGDAGDPMFMLQAGKHHGVTAFGIDSDCLDRSGEGDGSAAQRSGLGIQTELSSALRSKRPNAVAYGGNKQSGAIDLATACNAHGGSGRMDFETETFVCGTLNASGKAAGSATQQDAETGLLVTHSLRADGFDASEDGTGRGTPLRLAIRGRGDSHDLEYRDDGITPNGGRAGIGVGAVAAYGISSDAIDRSGEGNGSAGERAGLGIVADAAPSIRARPNNGVAAGMSVRRLTPRECERLQGFPDGYTAIAKAADGPRYRALGNSMAVPCMRWLGERIALIDALGLTNV
jgi:DNA (cytosine-5)-methyltransferase 1